RRAAGGGEGARGRRLQPHAGADGGARRPPARRGGAARLHPARALRRAPRPAARRHPRPRAAGRAGGPRVVAPRGWAHGERRGAPPGAERGPRPPGGALGCRPCRRRDRVRARAPQPPGRAGRLPAARAPARRGPRRRGAARPARRLRPRPGERRSTPPVTRPVEVAWFAALCDDDYEYLGVPDPELRSSWAHCRDITLAAERGGFDTILLPSGYALGIDSVAFAAGIAPRLERLGLLLAVRCGEMWVPQLARQLATIDQ